MASIEVKRGGNRPRPVIACISIDKAEDHRYCWKGKGKWGRDPTEWLDRENPDREGNHKVRHWEDGWKRVIHRGEGPHLGIILGTGFEGMCLDLVESYERFE